MNEDVERLAEDMDDIAYGLAEDGMTGLAAACKNAASTIRALEAKLREAVEVEERIRAEIPDRFILDPPDGGDVKTWEGVQRMRQEIEWRSPVTRDQLIETMARALTSEWNWECALETDEESQRYFKENSHTKEFEYNYAPNRSRDSYRRRATAALTAIEAAGMRVVPERTPVAWRVKDFADGWILFTDENEASRYAIETGALMQALAAQEDSTSE